MRAAVAAIAALVALTSLPALATSPARSASEFAGHAGNIIYLAAAVGLPLLRDGKQGKVHTLRAIDGMGVSLAVTYALKYLTKERRPNHGSLDSFPSGHATAAFSVATAESSFHPKEAVWWYLGAALISQSRVRIQAHHQQDVIAGALIGYGMTRLELNSPHGIILTPFISQAQRSAGITVTAPVR